MVIYINYSVCVLTIVTSLSMCFDGLLCLPPKRIYI